MLTFNKIKKELEKGDVFLSSEYTKSDRKVIGFTSWGNLILECSLSKDVSTWFEHQIASWEIKDHPLTITKTWKDIGFSGDFIQGKNKCFLLFEIYNMPVEGKTEDLFMSGSVKWDGCSNFRFDGQDDCMLHTCDREGMEAIGTLLTRIWDTATEIIEAWDK